MCCHAEGRWPGMVYPKILVKQCTFKKQIIYIYMCVCKFRCTNRSTEKKPDIKLKKSKRKHNDAGAKNQPSVFGCMFAKFRWK